MKKLLAILAALSIAHAALAQTNSGAPGGVSSVSTTCAVSGGGTGAISLQATASDSAVSATTYTLASGDCGSVKRFTNASAVTVTVPAPTGFATGYFATIKSDAANTAGTTVTPSGTTIDGSASSITLAANQSLDLFVNASGSFTTLPRKSGGGSPTGSAGGDLSGSYPNPTLSFASASAAAAAADADTFPTNQAAGTLKQTLAAIKTWIKSWFLLTGDCSSNSSLVTACGYKTAGAIPNNWYIPQTGTTQIGAQTTFMAANTIVCGFGGIPTRQTLTAAGAAVTTAVASGNFQIGLYSNVNTRPGSLITNTSSISTASAATPTGSFAATKQVGPGGTDGSSDLWWCFNVDTTAGGAVKFMAQTNAAATAGPGALIGSTAAANILNHLAGSVAGVSCAGANCTGGSSTFGSWQASLAASNWTEVISANVPIPVYQPTSVP